MKQKNFKESSSILYNIFILWKFLIKKRRLQITLLFLLMLIVVFSEVISLGAIIPFLSALTNPEILMTMENFQPVLHYLDIQSANDLLLPMTLFFVMAAVFASSVRILLLWSTTKLSASMGIQLRKEIYTRTLYQSYEYHISHNSSDLISTATEKVGLAILAGILHVLLLVSSTITSIAIIITLLFINTTAAILAFFILGGGYVLIGLIVRKYIKRNGDIIAKNQPYAIKCMQEGLGGIRDIIIDNSQNVFSDLYAKVATNIQKAGAQNAFLSGLPKSLLEMLGIILIASLAYYLQTHTSGNSLPILGALALGAQRLLPTMQQIYFSWTMLNSNQAIIQDVLKHLHQPLPILLNDRKVKPLPFKKHLRLEHISFFYQGSAKKVLHNINIQIEKGIKVGFIGSTGSGKSTLLDIIMGLLQPTEGKLVVDATTLDKNNIRNWQVNIAHVPQSIFLSDASLKENIAFGIPLEKIDMKKVQEASKLADIAVFIESLPEGYETQIGERGVQLSGGQRQRIGIARAFYKKAQLIVLDEATSALDNETEHNVMQKIDNLGKDITVLIIAHRLSTLKGCDIIYRLEDGKIKEFGTYEEIIDEKK